MRKLLRSASLLFCCCALSTACVDQDSDVGEPGEGWQVGEATTDDTETSSSDGTTNSQTTDREDRPSRDGTVTADGVSLMPVQWEILLDDFGPGVHTVWMLAELTPASRETVTGLSASLVWEETEVDLCSNLDPDEFITIREARRDSLLLGDGFQSTEQGSDCDINDQMAEAFEAFGLPIEACMFVETTSGDVEYCGPLEVVSM